MKISSKTETTRTKTRTIIRTKTTTTKITTRTKTKTTTDKTTDFTKRENRRVLYRRSGFLFIKNTLGKIQAYFNDLKQRFFICLPY